MSLYHDIQYAHLISSKLQQFEQVKPLLYNFRCIACGDSETDKYKKRGYFFEGKDGLVFKCHNCNVSLSFHTFLKEYFPDTYKEYIFEKFKTGNKKNTTNAPSTKEKNNKVFYEIPNAISIVDLPSSHFAYRYVENRKIPKQYWNKLFYTDNYKKWVNENIIPDKFTTISAPDERIIIPFFNKKREAFAFQGRALKDDENTERYITIKENSDLLIYGMDTVDIEKTIYLFEGSFDSMFMDNGIAAAGSSLAKMIDSELDIVFIFDQEARSKTIIQLMEKIIKHGRKIVIWPSNIEEKDVNAMVLKGLDIKTIIRQNTYSDLMANLKFHEWRKI